MTQRRTLPRSVLAVSLTAAMLLVAASAVHARSSSSVDPPSPVSGHAQVVATWLIDFEDTSYWWNVAEHVVDPAGTQLVGSGPTFAVGNGDRSVVLSASDIRVRLADGEAVFRPPRSVTDVSPVGTDSAAFITLTLSTTASESSSTQLDPGAGTHDVDLLRDTLAAGESMALHADIPAFVVVTAGSITGPDGTTTDAGGWQTLVGDFTLTNEGTDTAVVLVAIIGPVLQLDQPTTTTTSTSTTSTTAPPTTAAPTTSSSTTTTITTEPPTTATTAPETTTTTPPLGSPPPQGSPPSDSGPTGSV
jgi:hypothetical protein